MSTKKKAFSGYPGDCSEQQLAVLAKFRATVREQGHPESLYNDTYLLRFLRARKFNYDQTLEMWNNFLKWRKEKKVDQIKQIEIPEIDEAKKYYPHLYFRTDKLGRPVYIERSGKVNFDKLMSVLSMDKIEQHFIQDYERLLNEIFPACSEAKGETVCNTFYIMDMKGAASKMMSSKVWDLLKMVSKIGQDYYPEILGHMFIVNVPLFFYGVWNVVKHFVDEKTRKKIHIFGSSYKKELFQYIDENNVPDFLGGKATEKDYGSNMTNEQGPWVKSSSERLSFEKEENGKGSTGYEDERYSIELRDDLEEQIENSTKSVPVIVDGCCSIGDLDEFDLEVGQESPLKVHVKRFRPKPSASFNFIPL